MNGIEKVNGVKNQSPVRLALDLMDAKKIIVVIAIKNECFR
jgi:hypothetical protein